MQTHFCARRIAFNTFSNVIQRAVDERARFRTNIQGKYQLLIMLRIITQPYFVWPGIFILECPRLWLAKTK